MTEDGRTEDGRKVENNAVFCWTRNRNNVIHLSHYLPELDAGFLKWYSKYFGTNVPKPIIPNRRKIVDRELNTKT